MGDYVYRTYMGATRQDDTARLDGALVRLRRFLDVPWAFDDDRERVKRSTLIVLEALPDAPLSVSGVAAWLGVTHSTASRLVSRAVAAGAVTRTVAAQDHRTVLVTATPVGRDLLRRARRFRRRRIHTILAGWGEADVTALAALLERFERSVREHDPMAAG